MFDKLFHWLPVLLLCHLSGCAPVEEPATEEGTTPVETIAMPKRAPKASELAAEGMRNRIEAALKHVRERDLLTSNSFWTIFHGILGNGPGATLHDPLTRKKVHAIDWICQGGEVRGLRFLPTAHGLDVQTGPVFVGQGHQDQFIAEMAQWGMTPDHSFRVLGKEYTFADFIRHTQARARVSANQELSWAILIIGQYLGTDVKWTNSSGEKLLFEDVVRYELDQPIDDAACGGTHRLFGLTWAYHLHLNKGGKETGVWKDVAEKIRTYKKLARKYQNPDGSFSSRYLAGPGNTSDVQVRIGTTGHVLEWLALALSDEELREPWVQAAASALSMMILDSSGRPIDGGGLYHAAHGLHIYHARLFGLSKVTDQRLLVPLPPGQKAIDSSVRESGVSAKR
jgi:hypothetical protein